MTRTSLLRLLRLAPLTVALALPFSAAAHDSQAAAAFTFGRTGGNIAPFSVTIARDGHLTAHGPAQLTKPAAVVSSAALAGLLKLAKAEKFFAMPKSVRCKQTPPDFAASFLTITQASGTKTVTVHGDCQSRFTQLYAVVSAVAGVT
jgi:hypothetical protein